MEKIKEAEELFLNNYNKVSKEVLEIIKNAFIDYYGEGFRRKVENVFFNLRIIYMAENIKESEIDEQISKLSNDDSQLMKLGYYSYLKKKKKNDTNEKIILLHNEACNGHCEFDEWIEENLHTSGGSVNNTEYPTIYIKIEDGGYIYLQGLIHEISHSLMKEKYYMDDEGNKYYMSGIDECDDKPYFNELINEYITKKVMDKVIEKIGDRYDFLNPRYGSTYINIDFINGNLIKKVFLKLEDFIKESIIKGDPLRVKKLLNDSPEKVFDQINNYYDKQTKESHDSNKTMYDAINDIDTNQIKKRNEHLLAEIDRIYQRYLIREDKLNKYIDELEKNGEVRKINN